MRVLVIGSGGREHALAWALNKSPMLTRLFVAPGNAGTAEVAENVALDITDHEAVLGLIRRENIDFVVVGPDAAVVAGLGDDVRAAGVRCFAPSKAAAQLEGSKSFTKTICDEAHIPTAAYGSFDSAESALAYLQTRSAPIVVKADGLAAGKGVTVAMTLAEAEAAVRDCFAGAFGAAGARVVIEEFLEGEEASLFVLADGESYVLLPSAQDHKRAHDGDLGPNTGGMGAYSPAPVMTEALTAEVERQIIRPTLDAMRNRGMAFTGVLFLGLMVTRDGPKLIEYNVRFGDPECQVLMARLQSDALELLLAVAEGRLNSVTPKFSAETALTVVVAARGYPGAFSKGEVIGGLDAAEAEGVKVFHAGTRRENGAVVSAGGRVLNVTALGATVAEAHARAYRALSHIDWPGGYCRRDIGWRAISRG
jgi:phosphoribosylamine--glycine ligase